MRQLKKLKISNASVYREMYKNNFKMHKLVIVMTDFINLE